MHEYNLDNKPEFKFLGYYNVLFLDLTVDFNNLTLCATNPKTTDVHPYFSNKIYARIRLIGKNGNEKFRIDVRGTQNSIDLVNKLNGLRFEIGDYLQLDHAEPNSRLRISGISNIYNDLSQGCSSINLNESYFYLMNDNVVYSNVLIDNPETFVDKTPLLNLVKECVTVDPIPYTYDSFAEFQRVIMKARKVLQMENLLEVDLNSTINKLINSRDSLKIKNKIIFKNYMNETCLELSYENMLLVATTINENIVCPSAENKIYISVEIYNKKGIKKFGYNLYRNENALALASLLNNFPLEDGDFLKFYHENSDTKLLIKGSVKDTPFLLENGCGNLDLTNSFFYLNENLKYSSNILNQSSDTTQLRNLIENIKPTLDYCYTTKSSNIMLKEIKNAENLLDEFSVDEDEIDSTIKSVKFAEKFLVVRNKIVFKGYKNRIVLVLRADFNTMTLVATDSTSRMINEYYPATEYLGLDLIDRYGKSKFKASLTGAQNTIDLCNKINGFKFEKGDYFKFYHAEAKSRLVISEKIENAPFDLTFGFRELDPGHSFFYLLNEAMEIRYSDKIFTAVEYKHILSAEIEIVSALKPNDFEEISYNLLKENITRGNLLLSDSNSTIDDILNILANIRINLKNLKRKTKIVFKGLNDDNALQIQIDEKNKKLMAVGFSQKTIKNLKNKKFIEIQLYDKNDLKKASYSIRYNDNTLALASKINQMYYEEGDYLKFYHAEFDKKFLIEGYIENAPFDLSKPSKKLNLNNVKFYLKDGVLAYNK